MIGLEYICNLYNIQYKEIAEMLGISKQTINSWITGRRKIPQKYLPSISKKFDIPEDYFQKEINDVDKLSIQKLKIEKEMKNTDIPSISEYREINSKTKIGMTGLTYLYAEYYKDTNNLIKKLGITEEIFSKWKKGSEPIPKEKLKEIANFYNVKEEYIQKNLNHEDYVTLYETIFKNKVRNNELNKYSNSNSSINCEKFELLNIKLNELCGKKIYTNIDVINGGIKMSNILQYLTSYVFQEGNEKMFFIKDKYSLNFYLILVSDIEDIKIKQDEECEITIITNTLKMIISTKKQGI